MWAGTRRSQLEWCGEADVIGKGHGKWRLSLAKSESVNPDVILHGQQLRHGEKKYGKYAGFKRLSPGPLFSDPEGQYQRFQIRYVANSKYGGRPIRVPNFLMLFVSDADSANRLETILNRQDSLVAKRKKSKKSKEPKKKSKKSKSKEASL